MPVRSPPDSESAKTSAAELLPPQRRERVELLGEVALAKGGVVDPATAAEAGKIVGADYLVLSFYESGQDWSTLGGLHEILVSTTVADDPAAFTSIWSATSLRIRGFSFSGPSSKKASWNPTIDSAPR